MRIAVISDVHANLHALEAVLAEVDAAAVDELWCLGDLVGYGPRPNECAALLRERTTVCLAGNHDLVVLGKIPLAEFAGEAAAAAAWTRTVLDEEARSFLGGLEAHGERPGVELFHGSPRDPVWDYVLSADAGRRTFAATAAPLVLVGHSHLALELSGDASAVRGGQAAAGTRLDLDAGRRLLNPGSVGQPRDGDPRASAMLLDTDKNAVEWRRVEYPVERTQQLMEKLDLPPRLVARLQFGL
jgi:predicted phosphodiesterase